MEIKICGITNMEDRQCVVDAGADYFGAIVEFPRSTRSLTLDKARPFFEVEKIRPVAVTVNSTFDKLRSIFEALKPFAIQLHGDEKPELVTQLKEAFGCEIWKALHIPAEDLTQYTLEKIKRKIPAYVQAGVSAILFDTIVIKKGKTFSGGTGRHFTWDVLPTILPPMRPRFIIAGGLNATNVAEAVAKTKPSAVDVSSGVELYPGKKNHDKVRAIIQKVHQIPAPQ